ncbi:uncharacterized protein LOC142159545 [Mixophyes fleayi]|uniref:uncharacterized protein LOC142159545 n=1 Tax=Mixophyes fleayi TaxID=3061075 RepID=UPI003F4DF7CD
MMRHINAFVTQELFPGDDPPVALRRRFYPTRKDLANLMFKAKQEGRNSSLDQENVLNQLKEWKEQIPQLNIFCRPNTTSEEMTNKQSFILCYQAEWQQKLLQMYGNQITLLDATYRTTRYALPLFFLCVRTNVCYAIVGAFVIQQETSACIQEALEIFKKWNLNWNPKCFLVDFCLEEINAISQLFKDTQILLCDFHREKAWMEWVTKKQHGVHSCRSVILNMLRSVALATNIEEHNVALNILTNCQIWKNCDALRQWFSNKWMPEIKKWAHVFRSGLLHIAINTNNGLERQNETLKYTYLDGYKNCTLSDMITVLHSSFFPNTYKKYVQLNLRSSESFRKYHEDVPNFLKNRPREFIHHVMRRLSSNLDGTHVSCIDHTSGIFKVNSEYDKEKYYTVNLGAECPECTCEDWIKFLLPCKHMCCIFQFVEGWGWEKINPSYSNNALFILDTDCFSDHTVRGGDEAEYPSEGIMHTMSPLEDLQHFEPRRRTKRTTLIINCVQTLKNITDTVYLLKEETYLENWDIKFNTLLEEIKLDIPKDQGLPLIETPKKRKNIEKFEPLPKRKYGKPKHPASQRVGSRADMLRVDVWQSVEVDPQIAESQDFHTVHSGTTVNESPWVTVNGIKLTTADKEAVSNDAWLDDNVMNISQSLNIHIND